MSESKELTVPERAAIALGTAEHEKNLLALATKYADITKIVNSAGREQCHSAYMELKNTRVNIEGAGKSAREDANAFQKAVIKEVERLTAITAEEELRLRVLRDSYDAEREAERQAKAAADKARVDAIRAKIDEIKDCVVVGMGRSSDDLESAISELESTEITLDEYGEFAGEAQAAQAATVVNLKEMLAAQQAHEAEATRIAAEREALERQRAELAEQERQAAAARAEQEARDRAERERVEAEQRAAQERAAAAMRQQQAEHEARMAAERAELARQQTEIAAARAEQERVERERLAAIEAEERAKREAEEAEAARIAQAEADRIFAEQEAQRAAAEAAEAERQRRQRVEFEKNGPGADEIVSVLATFYEVGPDVARAWLGRHTWSLMEKAA
ncbi:coiled-coil domain-containing protein [Paraburkholderia graminis]|uniref:hypothetical protein n=1 Tax=Paraburkholderia graminis TaxID=60548 RepID=UPI0038B90095